ncbi:VC0807 family protein [Streptosporangium sp. NPDC006007]|uniref:VC0807 family protein n=1 Tax=Streptosporangium sp. NPDC006007 TaxID=3154575 RepID=UPI0033BB362C
MSHAPVALPRVAALIRQAVPRLLEGVIAPLAVFYTALAVLGLTGALIAAVTWVYAGVGWRLIRRIPVPGTMILAAIAITVRALLGLWSGSAVVYFLQPELGTICISMAFLASVRLNRPLAQRLALDYIHLPSTVLRHERVRRFFARITLLWAFVLLANSSVSIWLLLHESIGTYLLVRTSVVALISGLAAAVSIYAFRRVLGRLHHYPAPAALTA